MSVRLPFRTEQIDNHWKDFHENLYLSVFRKSIRKIQVPLKSDKKKRGTSYKDFSSYLAHLLELKIFHTNSKR